MDTAERIGRARSEVAQACRLLLSPTVASLDRSVPLLEKALESLAGCSTELVRGIEPFGEARALGREIRRLRSLLENAAAFHRGWSRRLNEVTAGYLVGGGPARVNTAPQLVVRG